MRPDPYVGMAVYWSSLNEWGTVTRVISHRIEGFDTLISFSDREIEQEGTTDQWSSSLFLSGEPGCPPRGGEIDQVKTPGPLPPAEEPEEDLVDTLRMITEE